VDLHELQRHWDAFGRLDPHWAILNEPGKLGGRWEDDAFFQTGRIEVEAMLRHVDGLGLPLPSTDRALDFGCGIGRVTQALCDRFERVDGVDIAPSMIEKARELNRFDDACSYFVNERDDLTLVDPNRYDFVYSRLVLQHMQPEYAARYITEFVRVLVPDGVALFQIPAGHHPPPAGEPKILPDAGFSAELACSSAPAMATGRPTEVAVRVRNASSLDWEGDTAHPFRVGNHWRAANSEMVVYDGDRVQLPDRVAAGEELEVRLVCYPPKKPGSYTLELDVVQEGVAWFADRGSPLLELPVDVVAGEAAHESGGADEEVQAPKMEMHAIPQREVRRLLERSGATLVYETADDCTGDWQSFLYCAVKRPPPRRWLRRR
jgi:SAM-dependent methyltransferase